ncbi:MAG: cold shock domain-containing protein [Planctomycetota bacterium]|nr:cold shock domain-containing protein [Planctomycetota bacterium]
MKRGTVKWFSDKKGFGFILTEDGQTLFVHHSHLLQEGQRTLEVGDKVEFEVETDEKGTHAVRVRRVGSSSERGW